MTDELDDQVAGEPRGIFCQHDADVVCGTVFQQGDERSDWLPP
jgi:hypothetical protein